MYKKSEIMKKGSYKTGQIAKLLGIAAPAVIRYCELGVIKASKNQNGHSLDCIAGSRSRLH